MYLFEALAKLGYAFLGTRHTLKSSAMLSSSDFLGHRVVPSHLPFISEFRPIIAKDGSGYSHFIAAGFVPQTTDLHSGACSLESSDFPSVCCKNFLNMQYLTI